MTNRRDFIKKSAMGTAAITIGGLGLSAKSYGSVIGANERITLAVIGIRGQGGGHIRTWSRMKDSANVRLKTICDVDEQYFAPKSKEIESSTGEKPVTEWDMRKVFEDKEIDAVSFGTPNHWHALGTIWACQAGKHVYVEKPASYGIWEGRKMVEAARKYNVRVQVGLQNRSIPQVMQAIKFMHDGGIGKVYLARGLCYKPRDSFGIAPDGTPPESLHYDMWLGPAPYRPYNEKRVHYNWHWFWATGGGDTANQGPHQFDIARWGLNKNEHPQTIYSIGGIYGIDPKECEQETPNTQTSVFQYADGTVLEFETRGRYTNEESSLGIRIGNMFLGTDGYVEINGSQWKAFRKNEREPFAGSQVGERPTDFMAAPGGGGHYGNFLEAIRAGNNDPLHCDIYEGYMSACLPNLANISYRLGKKLVFDGTTEKFVKDKKADKMLTREYRDPYVVPKVV
ncbi:MAG TPA: Gfo/Idh/MocA family oxidoreductase [Bacteroidales bacterium]|nr:Gfo/Idh/MocA family oxidoreductase [Bacteroidales bacterium]HPF02007.1 Gfo/Idh/MocA family oxidoreductase [Bacteroidales bacterium]HPJ60391.1 Gfo/Idh/MocA family oxidoreductase [Bacteroidales bacterium]HPR12577.1 Gfo/Idh/MocA family oxidoreductase [Bacteroidales bacterium]HRW86528.1 Gfo/Idh/MocA family oxidoreductase [Bacteroidales bacterium]